MKIVFISHSDESIFRFRLPVMRALKNKNIVYALAPNGNYSEKISKDFEFKSTKNISLNPIKFIFYMIDLFFTIRSIKPDLVQTSAHWSNIFGTICTKIACKNTICINLIEGLGSFYIQNKWQWKCIKILYKIVFNLSKYCIFVSKSDMDFFIKNKLIKSNKAFLIQSVGVDTNEFNALKFNKIDCKKDVLNTDKTVVLLLARAIKDKGVFEFYKAAENFYEYKNLIFVHAGKSDKNNPSCIDESVLKNNKSVIYLGHLKDPKSLLASADIFVMPSHIEGFSLALLEALSMGLIVLASDIQANKNIIKDGVNGVLFKTGSVQDLTEKIKLILNNTQKQNLMQISARESALCFDVTKIVNEYMLFYKRFADE